MATTSITAQLSRMGYRRARLLLGLAGMLILAVLIAVLLVRAVDTIEVVATLLFVPIFLLLLFFGLPGGLVAAAAATVIYIVLRADAIDAVGWGEFSGLIVSRSVAYLLFGAVGGWAASTLEMSLDKLDLYDQIDDMTGVNNARFLLQDIDLEKARSQRYQTVFSVSFVEIPSAPVEALSNRRRHAVLRELGRKLADGVRSMDRVAHGHDGKVHRIATILPETAGEGASVFQARLIESLQEFLVGNGVGDPGPITGAVVTIPGDDDVLVGLLEHWERIDASEHAT